MHRGTLKLNLSEAYWTLGPPMLEVPDARSGEMLKQYSRDFAAICAWACSLQAAVAPTLHDRHQSAAGVWDCLRLEDAQRGAAVGRQRDLRPSSCRPEERHPNHPRALQVRISACCCTACTSRRRPKHATHREQQEGEASSTLTRCSAALGLLDMLCLKSWPGPLV
ncbi:hypothetical protein CC78DRAFT_574863 [Lojkania enalia]|uniref:Uncharacterized protein n=1 Tax=Lojkania enalia TaxID=147567 RepID=A0A9P4TN90_9PLEO|nr:hypothetical protein CC78DRAFT_574863 [Didymosphaeria enalia]